MFKVLFVIFATFFDIRDDGVLDFGLEVGVNIVEFVNVVADGLPVSLKLVGHLSDPTAELLSFPELGGVREYVTRFGFAVNRWLVGCGFIGSVREMTVIIILVVILVTVVVRWGLVRVWCLESHSHCFLLVALRGLGRNKGVELLDLCLVLDFHIIELLHNGLECSLLHCQLLGGIAAVSGGGVA